MQLDSAEIESIPINIEALRRLPEHVARNQLVLPVSYRDGQLHLVIASQNSKPNPQTLDTLHFFLEADFTYDLTDSALLVDCIDRHYSSLESIIQNCPRLFRFRCPKKWANLKESKDSNVRFCEICERHVTYCHTEEQLNQLASEGKCVAFYDSVFGELLGDIVADG